MPAHETENITWGGVGGALVPVGFCRMRPPGSAAHAGARGGPAALWPSRRPDRPAWAVWEGRFLASGDSSRAASTFPCGQAWLLAGGRGPAFRATARSHDGAHGGSNRAPFHGGSAFRFEDGAEFGHAGSMPSDVRCLFAARRRARTAVLPCGCSLYARKGGCSLEAVKRLRAKQAASDASSARALVFEPLLARPSSRPFFGSDMAQKSR